LIEAPTPDWRVYSRFVRAISKRSGLEGAVPRRLIDNGLKVLVQIPTAARNARITRLNAELLRRNLSRLGADTDPALMRKALAAAEGALRQAAEQDPEDPGNDLEYALLYQAAALASSAKEDFEKYDALAEAMFRKAKDTHTASPSVNLEFALYCRRTWRYLDAVAAFHEYQMKEGRRHRVWRAAHIYVESLLGALRSEPTHELAPLLTEAAELAEQAINAGYGTSRLLCAYARVLHELGRPEASAEFFRKAFPNADGYLLGISDRR